MLSHRSVCQEGSPERDPDDPIGAVILVTLPDRTLSSEGNVKAFVFTVFGDNFDDNFDDRSGDEFTRLFLASV